MFLPVTTCWPPMKSICLIWYPFLKTLITAYQRFEKYFQNDYVDEFAWIPDPFKFTRAEEENLIELSCHNMLKTIFGSVKLIAFWMSVKDEYPLVKLYSPENFNSICDFLFVKSWIFNRCLDKIQVLRASHCVEGSGLFNSTIWQNAATNKLIHQTNYYISWIC